jgi:thiol:disulfide interchange protein DsbG
MTIRITAAAAPVLATSCYGLLTRRQAVVASGVGVVSGLLGCSKEPEPAPKAGAATGSAAPVDAARLAFETASRGTGFVVGLSMAARSLLVFFDPQCPHCASLWVASRPLRDRVRMVWMPVAFISPASGPQGVLLLAAQDPVAAMDQHEALLAQGQGGLPVSTDTDPERLAQVKANTELWKSLDARSVPHLVYRVGAEGPHGMQSGGLPTAELAQRLGL